jgi:hypothetical protein
MLTLDKIRKQPADNPENLRRFVLLCNTYEIEMLRGQYPEYIAMNEQPVPCQMYSDLNIEASAHQCPAISEEDTDEEAETSSQDSNDASSIDGEGGEHDTDNEYSSGWPLA